MEPALTPEEWAEFLDPANEEYAPLMFRNRGDHEAAATGLFGQPFGFTKKDVELLRQEAVHSNDDDTFDGLNMLADRIAFLLPPP